MIAQVVGSTLASGTLRLIFNGRNDHFAGTLPAGSDLQSFVIEFIITFYLMFVISGVATDNRAVIYPVFVQKDIFFSSFLFACLAMVVSYFCRTFWI